MTLSKPILTIAIPTFNRSSYLRDTINSIISQKEFIESDDVEIVVSDNCSTDDTGEVMLQFITQFPSKIKFSKNDANIVDLNFEKVLSIASGTIIKLNNDTLVLKPKQLKALLEIVKYCIEHNYIPYFLNMQGRLKRKSPILCKDISAYVSTVSYWCTWIGGFCITYPLFQAIEDFSKASQLQLIQVDILMRMLKGSNQFLVIPDSFFSSIDPGKKGGYNLPKIFISNYSKILSNYLTSKKEVNILKKEKKRMLFKFVLPWIAKIKLDYKKSAPVLFFDISNYDEIIKKEYSYIDYLLFKFSLITCIILRSIFYDNLKQQVKFFKKIK